MQLTLHSDFKQSSWKWFSNTLKVFLFQLKFGLIWEVWLHGVIIYLKIGHLKIDRATTEKLRYTADFPKGLWI